MSSLQLALSNALTGLNVNKQALAVLSQNIANANTPDYSRKIVNQQAQYLAGEGAGVRVADISRKVDDYLQQAIQSQQGSVGRASILDSYSSRVQALMGTPGSGSGIDASITSFFNSLQSLALSPDTPSLRQNAVSSGALMATSIGSLADGLDNLRYQADKDISSVIGAINKNLKDLFSINDQLANAASLGLPQNELLDRRDTLTREIAQNVDVNLFYRSNGTVQVYTAGGITLLDATLSQLSYGGTFSVESLSNDLPLGAIDVYRTDGEGNKIEKVATLVQGGASSQIVSPISTGKLRALIDLRDQKLPAMVEQLDTLAANLRDTFNAIHNQGSGYPGAASLTGTREVSGGLYSQWEGSMRISLLNSQGLPVLSPYADEPGGIPALTVDLSTLDSGDGYGAGKPTVQAIIDEINRYYATPQAKVEVGALNNIRLVSNTDTLSSTASQFVFDFDLQNLSAADAKFFVTNVQIMDDAGTDITSYTTTVPSVALASTSTFETTVNSNTITINSAAAHGLSVGDRIYIADPGSAINGIPQGDFGQYFTISNVTTTSFDITVAHAATSTGGVNVASQTALPAYANVEAGEQLRTASNGKYTADLGASASSIFYTIKATVGVDDGTGTTKISTITYKVNNNKTGLYNTRFSASSAVGNGTIVQPQASSPVAKAILVDAEGRELSRDTNGDYIADEAGYLKISALNPNTFIAIDSLDSVEMGFPDRVPPVPGTNRGFSHYFDLNNFFASNIPTSTGDTLKGSAGNLRVTDQLAADPARLSTGQLSLRGAPPDAVYPYWSYRRNISDNTIIKQLADLSSLSVSFAEAGGLGATAQTFNAYSGEILAFASGDAASATSGLKAAQGLLDGFTQRSSAISGVNIDEELANTVIYQNAYSASARIISVTNDLFDELINAF